jgi:hydrogenase maturation protein HypF
VTARGAGFMSPPKAAGVSSAFSADRRRAVRAAATTSMHRREITVRGIVQGVGFRPYVYGLASRLALSGSVRNTPLGVVIEVEGSAAAVAEFEDELIASPPPLATIDDCQGTDVMPRGDTGFEIVASDLGSACPDATIRITPDAATCRNCLAELRDPSNRRYRYPFITCATCGPRLTVVTGAPYDRERTTMRAFTMCAICRTEYEDPRDRRFHAETIACSACGPSVRLIDARGTALAGDPLTEVARRLCEGDVAAIKGLGGYHLACDATSAAAVAHLRHRKQRDEKPFAVMFGTVAAIEEACLVGDAERGLLLSPARPVVLLDRRPGSRQIDRAVAPGMATLGAMLPSTPLHELLMDAAGRPLVMTSGNRSHEPMVSRDDEALSRLGSIADVLLTHDRAIHVRCDDGVSRVVGDLELPIRRARGDAPRPIRLPFPCPVPLLAAGGHLKNTFALGRGSEAFVSHHIGDLDDLAAAQAFRHDVRLYETLLQVEPAALVHDLHPDYESTRYALDRAGRDGLATVAVQHHHAHIASCLSEHGWTGPAIGVAFDGSGFGGDGTVWGGEFLVGDSASVVRAAHLRQVRMPGGEQAVRQPWRMALACLLDAGVEIDPIRARHPREYAVVTRMIDRRLNSPLTSSAGRLFDAIACMAGLADTVSFEGQAAMRLEAAADEGEPADGYPFELRDVDGRIEIDTRPLVREVARDAARGVAAPVIGGQFHAGLADAIVAVCLGLRKSSGYETVALSGGVFLNRRLTRLVAAGLSAAGFRVLRHHRLPPNDGGLSLGQLAVAAARLTTTA